MPESYAPRLIAELQTHGVTDYIIDNTGKHAKLRFNWHGQNMMHVFPRTPSDSRGVLNCLSDLRRQLGVKRVTLKSHGEKRKRNVTQREESLTITVKSDPFEVLAQIPRVVKCPKMSLAELALMLNLSPP